MKAAKHIGRRGHVGGVDSQARHAALQARKTFGSFAHEVRNQLVHRRAIV
jgi:hypothetical protein